MQTFQSLADANMTTSDDAGAADAKVDEVDRASIADFSRLSVGLAVRQVRWVLGTVSRGQLWILSFFDTFA